jgi:hypothetical protein
MSEVRNMVVHRVCVNPRMVEALEEGFPVALVDVGRNGNFAVGDRILVRKHPEMLDLWELVGLEDRELLVDERGLPRDKRRPYWR